MASVLSRKAWLVILTMMAAAFLSLPSLAFAQEEADEPTAQGGSTTTVLNDEDADGASGETMGGEEETLPGCEEAGEVTPVEAGDSQDADEMNPQLVDEGGEPTQSEDVVEDGANPDAQLLEEPADPVMPTVEPVEDEAVQDSVLESVVENATASEATATVSAPVASATQTKDDSTVKASSTASKQSAAVAAEATATPAKTKTVSTKTAKVFTTNSAPAKASSAKRVTTNSVKQVTIAAEKKVLSGTYFIELKNNLKLVLDMADASKGNGGNAIVYTYNGDKNQRWKLVYNKKLDAYYIVNVNSGKVLDISGGKAKNKANVLQWAKKAAGNKNQLWTINGDDKVGYTIASVLNAKYVLDVRKSGDKVKAGGNVDVYSGSKNATNQRWYLLPVFPKVVAKKTIANGVYTIAPVKAKKQLLSVKGSSLDNDANVELRKNVSGLNQKWVIKRDAKTNLYTVVSIGSGKSLDVANAVKTAAANSIQFAQNGGKNQKWAIRDNGDGTYSFISKLSGMALKANGTKSGSNVRLYFNDEGTASEQWVLKPTQLLSEGLYSVDLRKDANQVLDVANGTTKNNTQLTAYSYNGGLNQKLQVKTVDADKNIYTFKMANSGKYLTASGNKAVQASKSSSKKQQWKAVWRKDGVQLVNVATGKALDIKGGSVDNGTPAITYKATGNTNQRFLFVKRNVIDNDMYNLRAYSGSNILDVVGASTKSGAKLDVWQENDGYNQKFRITKVGDYYKIVVVGENEANNMAVTAKGSAVKQAKYTGASSQLWEAQIAPNGGVVFVNKANGKALNVNGTNKNGTAVNAATVNEKSASQRWTFAKTVTLLDYQMRALNKVKNRGSATDWYIVTNITNHRLMVFHRESRNANWRLYDEWTVATGMYENGRTKTPLKDGKTGSKMLYEGGPGGTWQAWYWTYWGGTWYHSVLCYPGTMTPNSSKQLGHDVSEGCIRNPMEKAKWIYDNIPRDTGTTTWR